MLQLGNQEQNPISKGFKIVAKPYADITWRYT